MRKKPRFFCDNCGHEVDRNTRACPQCGRFFASVRCPSCGFTGDEKAFTSGCPSCGYSAPPSRGTTADTTPPPAQPPEKIPAKPLPPWVYILSICAFIGICAILYIKIIL